MPRSRSATWPCREQRILALCRALVGADYDPARPLCVYRDGVLALKVRSIGEGARLRVTPHGVGFIWEADRHERQGRPLASRLQEAAE